MADSTLENLQKIGAICVLWCRSHLPGTKTLLAAGQKAVKAATALGSMALAPQRNWWVRSGSGSLPKVYNKAILKISRNRKLYIF